MAEVSDGQRSDMDTVKMSGSRVWAAEETHGVLSRLFRAPKDPKARGSPSYHITAGSLVDVSVGLAPLRATNQTAEALFCKKEVDTRGKSDTRIFFWVFVLSILLRLVLLHRRHSYLGNRYWLGWGMGWSQRKRCWVVGVCRGAAAGQGWPMPRFVWILGGCWVGAKTTTGLTDTAWMGLSGC